VRRFATIHCSFPNRFGGGRKEIDIVNRRQRTSHGGRGAIARDEALARLKRIKDRFSAYIAKRYASKAVDCSTCSTPCCSDAEFVNVNITRLEGEAIMRTLRVSPRITPELRERILGRAREAVRRYGLDAASDTFSTTYACPLYEPGTGCLVHYKAKPAPCTQHGCYDDWRDLPDEIELRRAERRVADLNRAYYRSDEAGWGFRTIPVWIARLADEGVEEPNAENARETEPDAPLVRITRRRG
jgi:hypothetical protein